MVYFIEYGDIFEITNVKNYAHGCNCSGAMGKGIAVQFKQKFPFMYEQYKKLCLEGKFKLGDVYKYDYNEGVVFNLATQQSWKTQAEIKAIEVSLRTMLGIALDKKINQIALPKIGAGLGGGNWVEIKNLIIETANQFEMIDLFVVENYLCKKNDNK